jgi:hypothetical protein
MIINYSNHVLGFQKLLILKLNACTPSPTSHFSNPGGSWKPAFFSLPLQAQLVN